MTHGKALEDRENPIYTPLEVEVHGAGERILLELHSRSTAPKQRSSVEIKLAAQAASFAQREVSQWARCAKKGRPSGRSGQESTFVPVGSATESCRAQ